MKNACCEKLVPSSNTAQDGEVWTCPTCGKEWQHVCDEAEGCSWDFTGRIIGVVAFQPYIPPTVTLVGNVKDLAAFVPLPSPKRQA